jgi:hypothetical protein
VRAALPPQAARPAQLAPSEGDAGKTYPGLPRVQDAVWDSTITGKKNSEAWCVKWPRQIRDGFKNSKNDFISMGSCGCELAKNSPSNTVAVFEREYYCKFTYTYRQNVPDGSR